MHPSALKFGGLFFELYGDSFSDAIVVDIGSQDVNGSLHDSAPKNSKYIGVDFVSGKNVDIVLDDPYKIPFEDNSIDIVVCSSVFEHSQLFWVLFLEIIRILKPEGVLYLNAPSNGYIHRYPVDCWRFYPDSGLALIEWAKLNGYNPSLLESFIGDKNYQIDSQETWWNDYCAVFVKDISRAHLHNNRLLNKIDNYTNAYCDNTSIDKKENFLTDDFLLIREANSKIKNLELALSKCNTDNSILAKEKLDLSVEKENIYGNLEAITKITNLLEAENKNKSS